MSNLLKGHDQLINVGLPLLEASYGSSLAQQIEAEARWAFETLIPHIPDIGGSANPLTDTLVQMTSLLALYQVMNARGIPVAEVGDLVQRMAAAWVERYPAFARRMIGRLYMTQFWRRRTRTLAEASQTRQFAGNFVYEVVDGDGTAYDWGINYHECGVVKFFHMQGADEFTPYMCLIDYLMFPAMGVHLERHGTIANGCTHCDFRFKKRA